MLVHVVSALKAPNRRDGLKFGIFIVRTFALPQGAILSMAEKLSLSSCNVALESCRRCAPACRAMHEIGRSTDVISEPFPMMRHIGRVACMVPDHDRPPAVQNEVPKDQVKDYSKFVVKKDEMWLAKMEAKAKARPL